MALGKNFFRNTGYFLQEIARSKIVLQAILVGLISGLLVGAGVGLAVLFKINKGIKENLKIVGVLYAIGAISGILIELIGINF